jgi:hypothetical protein
MFVRLAKLAFRKRKVLNIPIISTIYRVMISYFADCLYPAANIELALKSAFGCQASILDPSYASSTGIRIGLPVSTIRKPSLCTFTNYNGIGVRDQDCGMNSKLDAAKY